MWFSNCSRYEFGQTVGGSKNRQPEDPIVEEPVWQESIGNKSLFFSEDAMKSVEKKRGVENLTNDTPPKHGFWTPPPPPRTVRFPPPSGVNALFFPYKNPRQSGPETFSGERVLWYVFLPPYVLHPPYHGPISFWGNELGIAVPVLAQNSPDRGQSRKIRFSKFPGSGPKKTQWTRCFFFLPSGAPGLHALLNYFGINFRFEYTYTYTFNCFGN